MANSHKIGSIIIPISEGIDESKTKVDGPGKSYVGIPSRLSLSAKDQNGRKFNAGGQDFDINVTDLDPENKKVPTKKLFYKGDGIYPLQFTPKRVGLLEIKPTFKGKDIFKNPINTIVDDPANAPVPSKTEVLIPEKSCLNKPCISWN